MKRVAWMQKQGDAEPAIVLSAIVGYYFLAII